MIGKQQLILDAKQFVSGMASSDFAPDGGLGTTSSLLNPFVNPGTMYSMALGVDVSTNVANDMIASAEDSQANSAQNRTMVDHGGNYYFWDGSSITKKNTGTATTHYTFGKTDMVSFAGATYTTLDNDMSSWNTSGTPALTESWWVTTKGQSAFNSLLPHPLLVFENLLWVADGGNLHTITSGGTIALNVLQLNSNELIQALSIDPNTGLMMISVQTTVNYSNTLTSKYFVYLFDGYSSKPRRKIIVDDLITAFYPMGGQVFIAYGQRLGVWNGVGITFLRRFKNVSLFGGSFAYKHHFSHVGNVLLVVDGTDVLAYGEVVAGKKAFFYVVRADSVPSTILWMAHVGSNKIAVAYNVASVSKVETFDISASTAGLGTLYFNNVYFPRPIFVRSVRVITTNITTAGGGGVGGFTFFDETGHAPTTVGFVVASTASPKNVFDFNYGGYKCQAIQPRVAFSSQGFGVIKVIIYYDVAE